MASTVIGIAVPWGHRFTSSAVSAFQAGLSPYITHPQQGEARRGVSSATSGRDVRPPWPGRAMVRAARDFRPWLWPGDGSRLDL